MRRSFEIVGIVARPPAQAGRGKKLTKSPVQLYGERAAIPVLTPKSASEEQFLAVISDWRPDLCITASYGNYLPQRFLSIPRFGTLNIHPSLLPRWRGAAPVQRSLESGDATVGVSVLFTVKRMDAGPITKQTQMKLGGDEQFPEVLSALMARGTADLLEALPSVWAGTAPQWQQDEAAVTEAPKFDNSDSYINFQTMGARQIHNRCRALCGTFGTWSSFAILDESGEGVGQSEPVRMNIISTVVLKESDAGAAPSPLDQRVGSCRHPDISVKGHILSVSCGDGSVLGMTAVQPATKRVMAAKDFLNGMKKSKSLIWVESDK